MAIDPQIPLSAAQPQSFAQSAGQTYQLAETIQKQQEMQAQQKDQQYIQQALKEGANFETPDGITAFAQKAKGNVSPKTYMTLTQAAQEAKAQQAQFQEHLLKSGDEVLKSTQDKLEFMKGNVEEPLSAYNEAKAAGKSEEEANLAFENAKAQKKQQIENMPAVGGQPVIPKAALDQYMAGNPAQFKSKFETVKSHQDTLMAAAKLRQEEQQTKTSAALEGKYKREPAAPGGSGVADSVSQSTLHGPEFLKLLSPGDQAQVKAVVEGRTQISDVSLRHRERISQLANQYDPGFTSISYAADKSSAVNISKDLTAIRPYEQMLNKNADIAVQLSKKAVATDSRLANKSINWLKQNVGDNPDVAEFLAQTTIVQTEAARVLNNPRLVGQLSDSARKEMESVISGDMPLKSYERVIRRLQQDGKNRVKAMEDERAKALKQIPKSDEAAAPSDKTNTGKSTAVPHETLPKGMPEGSKQAGHTPDGKPVWKAPNGKMYVEN